jgi:hypothetical protein
MTSRPAESMVVFMALFLPILLAMKPDFSRGQTCGRMAGTIFQTNAVIGLLVADSCGIWRLTYSRARVLRRGSSRIVSAEAASACSNVRVRSQSQLHRPVSGDGLNSIAKQIDPCV